MLIEWLLQCSASMLSGYLSCMFHAKMRKMEQAGGDGVCIHICWSSRQPGRPTGRTCSVGTSLPSPGTFSHLWSPSSTLGPPAVITSPALHSLISLLDITFHSMNLQKPLEAAARPCRLLHAPNVSPPLLPLASPCQGQHAQHHHHKQKKCKHQFPQTSREALRLFAPGSTD